MDYTVAALYRFVIIDDPAQFKRQVEDAVRGHGILGTLLIAGEGINGTLAGSAGSIDHFLQILGTLTGLPRCDVKFSSAPEKPFGKLKIRIKREIITFNQPGIDPSKMAGTYVEPQNWNELISDPDVLLIDTRNHYETTLGTFAGAHDPNIIHFSEFPQYVRTTLNAEKTPQSRDVLHGRHKVRKSVFVHVAGRLFRGLPPERRHPEIFGNRARNRKCLARRVLRLRPAYGRRPWTDYGTLLYVLFLWHRPG